MLVISIMPIRDLLIKPIKSQGIQKMTLELILNKWKYHNPHLSGGKQICFFSLSKNFEAPYLQLNNSKSSYFQILGISESTLLIDLAASANAPISTDFSY